MRDYSNLNDYEIIYMISENVEEAKELMFKKYVPLVRKEARYYSKNIDSLGIEYQDLCQAGYLAISASIKNYNSNKSILFYTYVLSAIRRKMLNLIRMSLTDKQKSLNTSLSLNVPVGNSEMELLSVIEDDKAIKPLDEIEKVEKLNLIRKYLYSLPINKASVLELKMNGFKVSEIMELIGEDKKFVNNVLVRIKKNLNLIIEKYYS